VTTIAAARPTATILDEALPEFDVHEVHERELRVEPGVAWDALRAVRPLDVRVLGPLMALRGLPSLLSGRSWLRYDHSATLLDVMVRTGFVLLGERPGAELAVGAIGRFWSLTANKPLHVASPADFAAFAEPGYAKAAVNFKLEPTAAGTLVRTETRIAGTDPEASRMFGRYWRVIYPGSALIRISWLNAIRRRAERP
jgi:hypothetical protein